MATDFIQQLKLKQLFGNQPQFGGQVNRRALFETPEIILPTNAPTTRTPFMDDYKNLLMNAPNRRDYEQGKIGKILALAAGSFTGATEGVGRGIAAGKDILDRPYNQAVDDYSIKGGRFKELADLEHRGALEERKFNIDTRKMELDEFKAISGLALDDARAKELLDRINTRGRSLQKNEKTGQLEVVNTRDGSRIALGQFAETPGEKDARDKTMFGYKEGVQHSNRLKLEGVRFGNDKQLTSLKAKLDKENQISSTQNNAAFEGAYEEAVFNNPELAKKIFDEDNDGNLVLKKKYDVNDYAIFVAKVNQRMNAKLGKEFNEVKFPTNGEPQVTMPNEGSPQVNDPLRAAAIQYLRDHNHDENDEENIIHAMEDLKKSSGGPQIKNIMPQSRSR